MKAYGRVDVEIHIFLNTTLVGGRWSASRRGLFTPGERTPGTHWIWDWVGPRAGLNDVEKRKFLTPAGLELGPFHRPAHFFFIFLFGLWDYWHCGHSWPIVPASGDSEDDCGEQMACSIAPQPTTLPRFQVQVSVQGFHTWRWWNIIIPKRW
jgi:hypothetical protein